MESERLDHPVRIATAMVICPGNSHIAAMRKLPVVLICRRAVALPKTPNQRFAPAYPAPGHKGRFAIVTDVGCGMRWTRQRRAREGSQGGLNLVSDRQTRKDERR